MSFRVKIDDDVDGHIQLIEVPEVVRLSIVEDGCRLRIFVDMKPKAARKLAFALLGASV